MRYRFGGLIFGGAYLKNFTAFLNTTDCWATKPVGEVSDYRAQSRGFKPISTSVGRVRKAMEFLVLWSISTNMWSAWKGKLNSYLLGARTFNETKVSFFFSNSCPTEFIPTLFSW